LSFAAPDSGSFSGKVVDGTSGASLPGGLVARLTGVTASGTAVAEPTATVGVDGRFASLIAQIRPRMNGTPGKRLFANAIASGMGSMPVQSYSRANATVLPPVPHPTSTITLSFDGGRTACASEKRIFLRAQNHQCFSSMAAWTSNCGSCIGGSVGMDRDAS
jgi:hypothetical protein